MSTSAPAGLAQPVLITGAAGFIGKNLAANLAAAGYSDLMLYDISSHEGSLEEYARRASFVFHLAGVNRPQNPAEFYSGNSDLTVRLLALLRQHGNKAPVLLTSSAQAGNGSDYAKSKEEAEEAAFAHQTANSSPVYVYRLPGVFGKWCRPSYNSVVATFCHNIANGLPLEIRDPAYAFPVCYIDDVISAFCLVLEGKTSSPAPGVFLDMEPSYTVSLGQLAATIQGFAESRASLLLPDMGDPLTKKLYAAYLSYLPAGGFSYPLTGHSDDRGSFTECLRSDNCGQVSVNIIRPGIVKGNHWHNTKNEKFLTVSGSTVTRFRKIDDEKVLEYPTTGEKLEMIDIPTGYTHNIENTGSADAVVLMWANEAFDPDNPDTIFEKV